VVAQDAVEIRVSGPDFTLSLDRTSGALERWTRGGIEFVEAPLLPHFWRAPVDNDVGAGIPEALADWRHMAESRVVEGIDVDQPEDGVVTIAVSADYGGGRLRYRTRYEIHASGDVLVFNELEPRSESLPEFYRLGMTLSVPGAFGRLQWLGRGPHESYADRKAGAAVGRWDGAVAEQFHDYSRPQETGNKVDVRWLAVSRPDGAALAVIGRPLLSVTALPFPYAELDYRPGEQRHGADLVPQNVTVLNIDLAQMGLGGDNSWGFWPLETYRLPPGAYAWSFRLRACLPGEDPAAISRHSIAAAAE